MKNWSVVNRQPAVGNRKHIYDSRFTIAVFLFIALLSCNSDYTVKRKGYFAIDFPKHQYQQYNKPGYPYTFEYPVYANVVQDSAFFEATPENPYWINVDFPRFNARIY